MRKGLGMHRVAVMLAVVLVSGGAAAEEPLSRTDSRHMSPVPPGGYELPLAPPLTQFPMRPQMEILNSKRGWNQTGTIDKELSVLCAQRRFVERTPMQFRAIFEKKDVLGVAFGNGTNLYDIDKKAKPGMVYLFRNGDSTACTVVALTMQELKVAQTQAGPAKGAKPGAKPAAGQPPAPAAPAPAAPAATPAPAPASPPPAGP